VCNLYSITKGQQAIRQLTGAMLDRTGNLPPLPGGGRNRRLRTPLVMTAPPLAGLFSPVTLLKALQWVYEAKPRRGISTASSPRNTDNSPATGSRRVRAADGLREGPLALERLYGLCPRRRLFGREFILGHRRFELFELKLHLLQQPRLALYLGGRVVGSLSSGNTGSPAHDAPCLRLRPRQCRPRHPRPASLPWAPDIQHTVKYTELAPDRFKDFWR
jgi:hypothetical protein